jgi:hypothetical protein
MKFHESHFEEYISATQKHNLHPTMEKVIKKFPNNIQDFKIKFEAFSFASNI